MGKEMKGNGSEMGDINGLIDKGCEFEGRLNFEGVVQINGGFKGEINSDGRLIVGRDADIKAKIVVGDLVVEGRVEGDVDVKGKIEVRSSAVLIGNITTQRLVVDDGGVLHGGCRMKGDEAQEYVRSDFADARTAPSFVEREEEQLTM